MKPLIDLVAELGRFILRRVEKKTEHAESPLGELEELQAGVTANDQEKVASIFTRWRNRRRLADDQRDRV